MQNYITPTWPAPARIRAYVSTREEGFSRGPFASFNLGDNTGDDETLVAKNRAKLASDLKLPTAPAWLKQIHSKNVVCLDKTHIDPKMPPNADASYTTQPNRVCVVVTADCLPLLFCTKNASLVAAIHAGWQGLAAGVVENTLETILPLIKTDELLVWLGPAVSQKAFIVKEEVRDAFLKNNTLANLAFKELGDGNFAGDLYVLARQILAKYGIKKDNIYGGDLCTFSDPKRFYSYRRDNQITGRQASLIWIAEK